VIFFVSIVGLIDYLRLVQWLSGFYACNFSLKNFASSRDIMNRIGVSIILLVALVLQGCGVANTMQRNEAADYYAQAAPMV